MPVIALIIALIATFAGWQLADDYIDENYHSEYKCVDIDNKLYYQHDNIFEFKEIKNDK